MYGQSFYFSFSLPSPYYEFTNIFQGGNATAFESLPLTVEYTCMTAIRSNMTVELRVSPYLSITWSWTKQCGVPLHGFNVGTVKGESDVVTNGVYDNFLLSSFIFAVRPNF